MLTRLNWWITVLILVIANYWGSLAWLGTGTGFPPAIWGLALVILWAAILTVLAYFEYLPLTKLPFWGLAGLGLFIALVLGLLIPSNSWVELSSILACGYLLVLVLTPLLLNLHYFWLVLYTGMFIIAYVYPPGERAGYAVHYLLAGLILAASRTGDLDQSLNPSLEWQQRRDQGNFLPPWQKLLWPVVFASFLVGSVVMVHSFLPVPQGNLREMVVTQMRSMLMLNNEPTYQVMQNLEAKGTIHPSDLLFMRVSAPYPDYWRGQSFDVYTGTGWQKKHEDTANLREEQSLFKSVEINGTGGVIQQFTFAKGVTSNIGFSGYLAKALAIDGQEYSLEPQGDVVLPLAINAGEAYRVLVDNPIPTEDEVRKLISGKKAETLAGDRVSLINPQVYLELPGKLPARVKTLTQKIVSGQSNPYDQAKAIESYLRANYPYSLELEKPPPGRDMVDYFLFTTQKGYCTYHASTMAVMLRTIGIPTRLIIGFTPGEWQEKQRVFEVRDRNAHAWVEAYFSAVGWVPFEPTSTFRLPGEVANENTLSEQNASFLGLKGIPAEAEWGLWALLFCLVCFAIIFIGIRLQKSSSQEKVTPITIIYRDLLAFLAGKGHPKAIGITPLEYIKGVKPNLGEQYSLAEEIVMAYLGELYGGKQLSGELISQLRANLTAYRKHKPRPSIN